MDKDYLIYERYKLYLSGYAYIPYQDLAKYKRAYTNFIKRQKR